MPSAATATHLSSCSHRFPSQPSVRLPFQPAPSRAARAILRFQLFCIENAVPLRRIGSCKYILRDRRIPPRWLASLFVWRSVKALSAPFIIPSLLSRPAQNRRVNSRTRRYRAAVAVEGNEGRLIAEFGAGNSIIPLAFAENRSCETIVAGTGAKRHDGSPGLSRILRMVMWKPGKRQREKRKTSTRWSGEAERLVEGKKGRSSQGLSK